MWGGGGAGDAMEGDVVKPWLLWPHGATQMMNPSSAAVAAAASMPTAWSPPLHARQVASGFQTLSGS